MRLCAFTRRKIIGQGCRASLFVPVVPAKTNPTTSRGLQLESDSCVCISMDRPSRPTSVDEVDLDAPEYNWINKQRKQRKAIADIIKRCIVADVDMTQFHDMTVERYVLATFEKALNEKLNPPPPPKPKSRSRSRGSSQPPPESDAAPSRHRRRNRSVPPPEVSSKRKDDPVEDKLNDIVLIATRIQNRENPAPRAVYFCVERQETGRLCGLMVDWRPGQRAALLARRSGVMFCDRSASEQYNNSRRFLALRANEGLLQATGKKPHQR